jgi:hypothetical protein
MKENFNSDDSVAEPECTDPTHSDKNQNHVSSSSDSQTGTQSVS